MGGKVEASVQKETKSPPAASRRPSRRRNGKKNARRGVEERQGRTCTWREIAHRHRRNGQAGGEMGRKMHAGEARNSRDQRAHAGKFLAGIVETAKLAEKQHEKCTPVMGKKVEAGVHKETKSPPAEARWTKRSDSRIKNARW